MLTKRVLHSGFKYLVAFREGQGDVAMLSGRACPTSGCAMGEGLKFAEVTKGRRPAGAFTLGYNATEQTSADISADATADDFKNAFKTLVGEDISVDRAKEGNKYVWRVSFIAYAGERSLLVANVSKLEVSLLSFGARFLRSYVPSYACNVSFKLLSAHQHSHHILCMLRLQGTGQVSVVRSTPGTSLPAGSFQLRHGENITAPLNVSSSDADVASAISTAFAASISTVQVSSVAGLPGKKMGAYYPKQFYIKIKKSGVDGPSKTRCTNPT